MNMSIGKNLAYLLQLHGMNAYQLQEQSNIPQPTTQRLLTGKTVTASARTIKRYSEFFDVDPSVLQYSDMGGGETEKNTRPHQANKGELMPIISWIQAGAWTANEPSDGAAIGFVPMVDEAGKNGFALIVEGESMMPDFAPNDRIYVNPDIQPDQLQNGDLVVMQCSDGATFKRMAIESGRKYLQALNPDWPNRLIEMPNDCRLVGLVVGSYRPINRKK